MITLYSTLLFFSVVLVMLCSKTETRRDKTGSGWDTGWQNEDKQNWLRTRGIGVYLDVQSLVNILEIPRNFVVFILVLTRKNFFPLPNLS